MLMQLLQQSPLTFSGVFNAFFVQWRISPTRLNSYPIPPPPHQHFKRSNYSFLYSNTVFVCISHSHLQMLFQVIKCIFFIGILRCNHFIFVYIGINHFLNTNLNSDNCFSKVNLFIFTLFCVVINFVSYPLSKKILRYGIERERKKRERERNDYLHQKGGKRINIILFLISSHGLSVLVLTIDMLLIGML